MDAGADGGPDAGADGGPGGDGGGNVVVTFVVPAGGGSVQVTGSQVYTFTFPADVGGQTFTIEVLPADSYGFDAGQYVDIFKLGPNGTQFTTPVVVAPMDVTNLPPVAFLYPEPVVAAGAEALIAVDGGYMLPHFSAYAQPALPNSFCSFDDRLTGTADSCVPFTYDPLNVWWGGDEVAMPGLTDLAHNPCTMRDTCMTIICWNCAEESGETDFSNGIIWCPGGSSNFSFSEVAWQGCPADVPPAGCQLRDGKISATGCGFVASCSGDGPAAELQRRHVHLFRRGLDRDVPSGVDLCEPLERLQHSGSDVPLNAGLLGQTRADGDAASSGVHQGDGHALSRPVGSGADAGTEVRTTVE